MAPTNTRQGKTVKNPPHEVSDSEPSDKEDGKNANNSDPLALSGTQMETVALLVKSAVAAAVAQVLPMQAAFNQNASGMASPGTSAQTSTNETENANRDLNNSGQQGKEEGEILDPELDDYEKELSALLGDDKVTGPEISERISRLLDRCLGNPLDEKVVKLKREAYPRPENVANLKVPRTNPIIFSKITTEHQGLDRAMQITQSYLVAGITAVGCQAEKLLGLRTWAASLEQEEKDNMPEQVQQLTGIYVHLMDSLILLIGTMSDMTGLRRRMIRNDLVEPYKSLMEDEKNPPTPDWLGGDDVPAAIRKAKANAGLADDLARRGKWPRRNFNRNNRGNSRPYEYQNPNRKKGFTPKRDDHESSRGG